MRRLMLALAALLAAACSGIALEPQPPPGFDLSGDWVLVADASEAPPSRRRLRAQGGMLTFITRDFPVLTANQMQIEQGPASMGISYGVGNYRDITWGTRRRGLWEVRAGWHEGTLMVLSEASDASASEVFVLSDDGRRLRIDVVISSGGDDVSLSRVFRRN
jgi:hypothetical protein